MVHRIINYFKLIKKIRVIRKNDIVIDCGANVGDISKYFLRRKAIVHAFEPNPFAFEILSERFPKKNITYYQQAVFNEKGKKKLFLHEWSVRDEILGSTGSSLFKEKDNVLEDKFVEVEVIRLVDFINKINKQIRILKIDIEGAEYELLTDLIHSETYKKIDFIYVETHAEKYPIFEKKHRQLIQLIQQKKVNNIHLDWF